MPNRPGRNRVFNPIYNPPRLPETGEREFLPSKTCNVNSTYTTNNQNPLVNFQAGSGSQYYGLLEFDLTGYLDGLVDFEAAGILFGGSGSDINTGGTIHVGVMKPDDLATWTSSATWNTKDGSNAWTGGAGGFRQPSTEISWVPTAMPGVVTAGKIIRASEGSFPTRNVYHSRYDSAFPYAAFAEMLNSAILAGNGKVALYVYVTGSNDYQCRQGSTFQTQGERFRLVVWDKNINTGLGWVGTEPALYPPISVYETVAPNNAGVYGYPYFDMTTVDPSNVTANWHGGSNTGTGHFYSMTVNTTTGASLLYTLMHFDLSEFIGRNFDSVILRFYGGSTLGSGGTVNTVQCFVAQAAHTWAVGNGGGVSATSGPTWTLQEKSGSVAWPGAINVGSAGFIDTAGQAETACTVNNSGTSYTGSGNTAFTNVFEVDITDMVQRALTVYAGHLWLRLRFTTASGGTGGWPTVLCGPTGYLPTGYNGAITQNSAATACGYRTFPHLKYTLQDPFP